MYTAGGTVNCHSHCEKQHVIFSKNWKWNCHITQQSKTLVYIQKKQKHLLEKTHTPQSS